MDFLAESPNTSEENCSDKRQVNNDDFTLYDKNWKRLSDKIKSVNEYYTPKFHHLVESNQNDCEVTENKVSHELFNEEIKFSFYNELHTIMMKEIESRRKTELRSKLKIKMNILEQKRKECSNTHQMVDEESKYSVRERLAIDRNYDKNLLERNDNEFQNRLYSEQNKINQRKRNIRFSLVLNNTCNLLNEIKQMLSESKMNPQLLSNHMKSYMIFETYVKELKVSPQNVDEENLLAFCQISQNIHDFYKQLKQNVKSDALNNFEFKINENDPKVNNKSEELKKFTFKIDEKPEVKSNEFFTFKFKVDKKVVDSNISNFSFKMKQEDIKKYASYNFEEDYKLFLENHQVLQKNLNEIENSYSSFLLDDSLKVLKRELIKSIFTPVNCISSTTPWHMKDKFDKLDALLKCKTVETGNSRVSANSHKDALTFCKHTLAKKLVNFAENVADVNKQAAFEVASIATELWLVHPDFGIILYATFKQKCPCLIPYNAIQTTEQTDEEYYKSLGYNYTNGVVEKQDKYVKRMTGIIRLFAAIIVTETRSGKALGIAQAWMLIAATVNLAPQLDVTAVFLHEMLITTGYDLKKAYGRQFTKMLKYIESNYMKKIDEVTPITCAGPVQRFKTFISKAIKVGYIERPKDIIPYNFW